MLPQSTMESMYGGMMGLAGNPSGNSGDGAFSGMTANDVTLDPSSSTGSRINESANYWAQHDLAQVNALISSSNSVTNKIRADAIALANAQLSGNDGTSGAGSGPGRTAMPEIIVTSSRYSSSSWWMQFLNFNSTYMQVGMWADRPLSMPASALVSMNPVFAVGDGTIMRAGWQPGANSPHAGLGFRVSQNSLEGGYWSYGHLDPASVVLQPGDFVHEGGYIGDIANPTNGSSSGPHVHVEYRLDGAFYNPGSVSPLGPSGFIVPNGGGYGEVSPMHPDGHQGIDYAYPH